MKIRLRSIWGVWLLFLPLCCCGGTIIHYIMGDPNLIASSHLRRWNLQPGSSVEQLLAALDEDKIARINIRDTDRVRPVPTILYGGDYPSHATYREIFGPGSEPVRRVICIHFPPETYIKGTVVFVYFFYDRQGKLIKYERRSWAYYI